MAEDTIDIRLTLDTQQALSALRQATGELGRVSPAAANAGRAVDQIGRGAASIDRTRQAASNLNQELARTNNEAQKAGQRLSGISASAVMGGLAAAGGQAFQMASAAANAYGHERAGGYLGAMGSQALSLGMAGAMESGGNPYVAAGSAVAGAAMGAGTHFFNEIGTSRKEAEALERALAAIRLQGAAAGRALGRMETPDQLAAALQSIRDQIHDIGEQARNGLVPQNLADARIYELRASERSASDLLGSRRSRAEDDRVAAAQRSLSEMQGNRSESQAAAAFMRRLSGSTAEGRQAIIEARLQEFETRAAALLQQLGTRDLQSSADGSFADALSTYQSVTNEIDRLRNMSVANAAAERTGLSGSPLQVQTNALTRIGGLLSGGGMSSTLTDTSRATANNTRFMVQSLSRIEIAMAEQATSTARWV